jgi:hypothetical protein
VVVRLALARSFVAGFAIALGACSLIVSTDGLAGAPEAAPLDAAGESAAPDGSTTASSDGGADGSAKGFCAAHEAGAVYCEDFDRDPSAVPTWRNSDFRSGGTLAIDDMLSFSAPRSLIARADPVGDKYSPAYGIRSLDVPKPSAVVAEAEILVDRIDPSSFGAPIFGLQLGSDLVFVRVRAGTADILEEQDEADGGTTYHAFAGVPLPAGWSTVRLGIDLATRAATIEVAGVPATSLLAGPAPWTRPGLVVGLYYPEATGVGWTVHYDDVLVTVVP